MLMLIPMPRRLGFRKTTQGVAVEYVVIQPPAEAVGGQAEAVPER